MAQDDKRSGNDDPYHQDHEDAVLVGLRGRGGAEVVHRMFVMHIITYFCITRNILEAQPVVSKEVSERES